MPKIKTHKGTAKRISQTGTGKLMHRHTRQAHAQTKKSGSRLRKLYQEATMYAGKLKHVKRQLPYGVK